MLPLRRMWINQPSSLQPDYKQHRINVLADMSREDEAYTDIWYLSGPVISSRIAKLSLSPGWIRADNTTEPTTPTKAQPCTTPPSPPQSSP